MRLTSTHQPNLETLILLLSCSTREMRASVSADTSAPSDGTSGNVEREGRTYLLFSS